MPTRTKEARSTKKKENTSLTTPLSHKTGHRPANAPTNRLALVALHNLPDPALDQHPGLQAAPLRSAAALLGLRGLPRPAGARERARLHPHPTRQSVPEPLRRQRD